MLCLKRLIVKPVIMAIQLNDTVSLFLTLCTKSSENITEIGRNHSQHHQKGMSDKSQNSAFQNLWQVNYEYLQICFHYIMLI